MPDSSIAKLREQAERCRRLSKTINDETSIATLRKMADELETEATKLAAKLRDC